MQSAGAAVKTGNRDHGRRPLATPAAMVPTYRLRWTSLTLMAALRLSYCQVIDRWARSSRSRYRGAAGERLRPTPVVEAAARRTQGKPLAAGQLAASPGFALCAILIRIRWRKPDTCRSPNGRMPA